jgi:predicted DNA-binding protein
MADRLRQMADRYGYTVTALIRNCVEARIDLLDQQLARQAAREQETSKS